jgi:phosphoglycolate phosphatase
LNHPDSEIRRHVGPPLQETFKRLLGADRDKVDTAVALYRERYGREGYLENRLYPGVLELLESLRARRVALFVATSKPLVFTQRILDHFGLTRFFKGIYGSELDGTRSRKTDLVAHLLQSERLTAAETVMIGDLVGAIANDVQPVAALWGYGTRDELAGAGAKVICERPRDVLVAIA